MKKSPTKRKQLDFKSGLYQTKDGSVKNTKKVIKGFAVVNTKAGHKNNETVIWGQYGVGVSPMYVFHQKKRAEFMKNQPEHIQEVAKGNTKVVPCEISYLVKKTK